MLLLAPEDMLFDRDLGSPDSGGRHPAVLLPLRTPLLTLSPIVMDRSEDCTLFIEVSESAGTSSLTKSESSADCNAGAIVDSDASRGILLPWETF